MSNCSTLPLPSGFKTNILLAAEATGIAASDAVMPPMTFKLPDTTSLE